LLLIKDLTGVDHGGLKLFGTCQEGHYIGHVFQAIDIELVDNGGLVDILFRDDETFEVFGPCLDGDGQDTLHRLQLTIEAELTNHHILVEFGCVHLS